MRKSFLIASLCLGVGFVLGHGIPFGFLTAQTSKTTEVKEGSEEQVLRKLVGDYATACSKADLQALANFWAADAEFITEEGKSIKGQGAILDLYKKFFAENKGAKFTIEVSNLRLLKGDIALQDGTVEQTLADGSVGKSRYSAVWRKADGKWQIQSARDLPVLEDIEGAGSIKDLEWLLGEWTTEKGGLDLKVQYSLNKKFLELEYNLKEKEGDFTVKQLIGFDPLTGQLKSWTFDSRGGYGEGLWTRQGNSWFIETAGVLSGGQTGTGNNILKFKDKDTFIYRSEDREIEGEPIPDSEATIIRKAKQ